MAVVLHERKHSLYRVIDKDWSGEIAAVVIVPSDWQFKAEENCIITASQENVLCKEGSGSARKTEVKELSGRKRILCIHSPSIL